LLTCPKTKEQYVGSATGEHVFWGRWLNYLDNGHRQHPTIVQIVTHAFFEVERPTELRLGFSTRVVVAGSQNVSPAFQKSGAGLRVQNLSNAPSKVTQKLFFKIVAGPAEAMWPVKPIFGVNWRDCQMDGFKLIALRRLACAMP
jgi:hypothetical protein